MHSNIDAKRRLGELKSEVAESPPIRISLLVWALGITIKIFMRASPQAQPMSSFFSILSLSNSQYVEHVDGASKMQILFH